MNAGDRIGKYRLLRCLGGGAMGVVWAATNEATGKEVALKLLPSPNEELRRRLLREAKACGRLEHRNIVTVYDTGTTPEGEPFLVMALLNGETLASRLQRVGRLPPEIAAGIGAAIASGLATAHAEKIVHRDLKPDNVFLHREPGTAGEVVKILDFGISRVDIEGEAGGTATGMLIGSPTYMSPEQARGAKLDARSDLWSLGVVLFEMITGGRPFPGPTIADALVQVMTAPIPQVATLVPGVPWGLSTIVASCLIRELERRPASAAQLAAQLLPFAMSASGQHPILELPGGLGPPSPSSSAQYAPPARPLEDEDDDRRRTVPAPPQPPAPADFSLTVPITAAMLAAAAPSPAAYPHAAPAPAAPPAPPALASFPTTFPVVAVPVPSASSSTTPITRPDAPLAARPARDGSLYARLALLAALVCAVLAALIVVVMVRGRTPPQPVVASASPPASSPAPAPAPPEAPSASAAVEVQPAEETEPSPEASASPSAAAQSRGELRINSIPVAKVVLDGKPLGTTPKVNLMVPAGPHSILFIFPNGERRLRTAIVRPGLALAISERQSPSAPAAPSPRRAAPGHIESPGF